ncbi:MAG: hypothetical protein ABI308_08180 [Mucilaginibacter sp.]
MKHLALVPLLIIALASCKKLKDTTPVHQNVKVDTSIHHVSIAAADQYVKTSVTDSTLTLVYNEDINPVIKAQGYSKTWAVHLIENFAGTSLSGFHYITINQDDTVNLDWVDGNLNNVKAKTVADTTIKGVAYIKINVNRPFTFTQRYATVQEAVNAQNSLLNRKSEAIKFTSYVFFMEDYPTTVLDAKIIYTK